MSIRGGRHPRQRGIAVITALLIVALGTITMVAIASRQQLDMQRERNEALIQQARDLAASGERFAAVLLYRDRKEALRDNTDSLDDDWAQTIPPVPIDNAAIQGCITDMQGRFNLNNLVDPEGRAAPLYVDQLRRLLGGLNIETNKAEAIVDWIDTNIDPTIPDGAEDDYYTSLDPGYRAANAPFASVSELQLIKGFDPQVEQEKEDYELLLPHVSALPSAGQPTAVNVNTATPAVISSMGDDYVLGGDLSRWETLAYEDYPECEDIFDLTVEEGPETLEGADRDLTPYTSVQEFRALAGGDEVPEPGADGGQAPAPQPQIRPDGTQILPGDPDYREEGTTATVEMAVMSRFFETRIDVIAEGLRLSQFTLFERDEDGRTRIVRRTRDTL